MPTRQQFLNAINAAPDNVALRLQFADMLEEQGDPMCEEWRKPISLLLREEPEDGSLRVYLEFGRRGGDGCGDGWWSDYGDGIGGGRYGDGVGNGEDVMPTGPSGDGSGNGSLYFRVQGP